VLPYCDGDPGALVRAGKVSLLEGVRRELPRLGGKRVCHRIVNAVWDALSDTIGVAAQRRGGLGRADLVQQD